MSYNPLSTDSRSNSPVPFSQRGQLRQQQSYGQSSSAAPSSPHLEQLDRPHTIDHDLAAVSPLTRHQRLLEQIPTRDPFQSTAYQNSAASPQLSSSISQNQYQQYPQQYQHQASYGQQQQLHNSEDINAQPSFSPGPRPASPLGAAMRSHQRTMASSAKSYDARDNSSHRSSHNLAVGNDPNYNMTQTDSTLEGLAEQWQAYQAWWAKQYKEQPFYRIWTRSKWILLFSALLLLGYSCAVFGVTLGYMTGRLDLAVVVMEFHSNLVYIAFCGSIVGILSALVGLIGVFKENRIWLSWYTMMLWPVFALYVSVGYIAFRRAKNHLRAHLKDEWIHSYSREQRLLVQRNLKCCGFQDASWYGEYDLRCFPMINLPGCQHKYTLYEDKLLSTCWTASFVMVPFQLFVMIAALLCSNHVDGMLRSGRPGLKSFKEK